MKIRLAAILVGFLFTGMVLAEKVNALKAEPEVLLRARLEQVMTVLRQKDLDPNIVAARVEKIATPLLDLEAMPRLAIKRHWKTMSKEQQTQYQTLFIEYLKASYRSKLMLYSNEEITYKKPVITRPGLVQIPTELKSKDKIMKVLYYFRKTKAGYWKIYNVNIEGVRLIESYRAQFNEVIQKDGIDALLEQLKSSEPVESAPDSPSE